MFLNISVNGKKKLLTIVFGITIIIFILGIFSMLKYVDKLQNGKLFKGKLDLSFSNYYTTYDMTVISNKNIHTYAVKEWHEGDSYIKLEYLDYMKDVVTITLENGECTITNNGNIAKLVINNMWDNKNISSLSTFGYLYNNMGENCSCVKTEHEKDNEIVITIEFKEGCTCGCNKLADDLQISKLKLDIIDNLPKTYTIYSKNKKEYICIVYNVFEKTSNI